jgi:predicted lipoprotein with Yx(FWY)xxD motif
LYVCLDDVPARDAKPAVSECDTICTVKRPVFGSVETGRTTLLPSVINPEELRELVRPDGQLQLTYRGWPLYYYSGDIAAGSTASHNDRAWRAIDPVSFGSEPARNVEE